MKRYIIALALATLMGTAVAEREVCGCASWQALAGAGYSWAMNDTICTSTTWASSTTNCGNLGESPFYFVGFSKNVWRDWLNVGFKYTAYNGFTYNAVNGTNTGLDFVGFDLGNTSYLVNLNFAPQFECIENRYVAPLLGVGIGLSHFTTKWFQRVANTTTTELLAVGRPSTSNAFAAEVLLGLQSVCSDNVSFGLFYSFYYAGKYCGPCRIAETTNFSDEDIATTFSNSLSTFKGTLKANQISFRLEWKF